MLVMLSCKACIFSFDSTSCWVSAVVQAYDIAMWRYIHFCSLGFSSGLLSACRIFPFPRIKNSQASIGLATPSIRQPTFKLLDARAYLRGLLDFFDVPISLTQLRNDDPKYQIAPSPARRVNPPACRPQSLTSDTDIAPAGLACFMLL